jgi:hypothetical protein
MRNCVSCGGGAACGVYDCRHWDWYTKKLLRGLYGAAWVARMCWYPEGCLHVTSEDEE